MLLVQQLVLLLLALLEQYGDLGYDFGSFSVAAQIASTDYKTGPDSTAYAAKIGFKAGDIDLTAAVSNTTDNAAGVVSRDNFYTSSWNTFGSRVAVVNEDTLSWKVSAATELAGLSTELSYAQYGDEGSELDVIVGYDITKCMNLSAVYTSTDYDVAVDESDVNNALEVMATYKF